jgi:hypothetical protein
MCTELLLLRRRPFVELGSKPLSKPWTPARKKHDTFPQVSSEQCGTTAQLLEHHGGSRGLIPWEFWLAIDQVLFNKAKATY